MKESFKSRKRWMSIERAKQSAVDGAARRTFKPHPLRGLQGRAGVKDWGAAATHTHEIHGIPICWSAWPFILCGCYRLYWAWRCSLLPFSRLFQSVLLPLGPRPAGASGLWLKSFTCELVLAPPLPIRIYCP